MSLYILNTLMVSFVTIFLLLKPMPTTSAQSTENDFIVELLAVVDKKGFDVWKKNSGKTTEKELKEEIKSYIVEGNELYKSLDRFGDNLKIQIESPEIVVLKQDLLYGRNGKLQAVKAQRALQRWADRNKKKYDVAIIFTGYDLWSPASGTDMLGRADIGVICQPKATTAIEMRGMYLDPLVVAHEIGHLLGALHDGTEVPKECPYEDAYIMSAGIIRTDTNHFLFSKCSYNAFYKTLVTDGKGKKCLKDGDVKKIPKGPRLGKLMTPDSMCQRRFGMTSHVDREAYLKEGYGDNVCTYLKCKTSSSEFKKVATHQGMACAKNKECIQGQCQHTLNGASKSSDTCPIGDQIPPVFKKRTCASLKYTECYNWQVECCQTCANFKDSAADKACRRLQGPKSALVRDRYTNWGDEVCSQLYCSTGEYSSGLLFKVHATPEGMNCGKNKQCKSKKCLPVSSGGDTTLPDHCPFGDQPWIPGAYARTCPDVIQRWGCSWRFRNVCCQTCRYKKG